MGSKKIVAVLNDLMFTVKIQEAAKRAGLEPVFVKTQEDALRLAVDSPTVIVIDLNTNALEPLRLIDELKKGPATKHISLIGFVSHVQVELKQAALERGCDVVMARSAFSQNLPAILATYAESRG